MSIARSLSIAALMVWLGAAACGSTSSSAGGGSASVIGMEGGGSVALNDAIAVIASPSGQGVTVYTASVILSNVGGLCSRLQSPGPTGPPPNADELLFVFVQDSPISPGSYAVSTSVPATGVADALFVAQDANCKQTVSDEGTSGKITLQTITSTTLQGDFDVVLQSGAHLTGSFTAPVCSNVSPNNMGAPPTGTCVP